MVVSVAAGFWGIMQKKMVKIITKICAFCISLEGNGLLI